MNKFYDDGGNKKNSFKVDVFQKLKFSSIPKKIYKTMQVMPVFEFFLKIKCEQVHSSNLI